MDSPRRDREPQAMPGSTLIAEERAQLLFWASPVETRAKWVLEVSRRVAGDAHTFLLPDHGISPSLSVYHRPGAKRPWGDVTLRAWIEASTELQFIQEGTLGHKVYEDTLSQEWKAPPTHPDLQELKNRVEWKDAETSALWLLPRTSGIELGWMETLTTPVSPKGRRLRPGPGRVRINGESLTYDLADMHLIEFLTLDLCAQDHWVKVIRWYKENLPLPTWRKVKAGQWRPCFQGVSEATRRDEQLRTLWMERATATWKSWWEETDGKDVEDDQRPAVPFQWPAHDIDICLASLSPRRDHESWDEHVKWRFMQAYGRGGSLPGQFRTPGQLLGEIEATYHGLDASEQLRWGRMPEWQSTLLPARERGAAVLCMRTPGGGIVLPREEWPLALCQRIRRWPASLLKNSLLLNRHQEDTPLSQILWDPLSGRALGDKGGDAQQWWRKAQLDTKLRESFRRGPLNFLNRTQNLDYDEPLSVGAAESILAWFGNRMDKSYELWSTLQGKRPLGATTSEERH